MPEWRRRLLQTTVMMEKKRKNKKLQMKRLSHWLGGSCKEMEGWKSGEPYWQIDRCRRRDEPLRVEEEKFSGSSFSFLSSEQQSTEDRLVCMDVICLFMYLSLSLWLCSETDAHPFLRAAEERERRMRKDFRCCGWEKEIYIRSPLLPSSYTLSSV